MRLTRTGFANLLNQFNHFGCYCLDDTVYTIYIYMYIYCIHLYIHSIHIVCMHACMYGWMDACIDVWMYGRMDVRICIYIYIDVPQFLSGQKDVAAYKLQLFFTPEDQVSSLFSHFACLDS